MDLPEGQFKRLDRMRCERHYLLDFKMEEKDCILSVSGSTGNIYTIVLNEAGIECDCPDFGGYAEFDGLYCKHCCFVIYRVLSSRLTAEDVDPRRIAKEKLLLWQKTLAEKSMAQLKHVTSPKLCEKYSKLNKEEERPGLQEFGIVMPDQCKIKEKLEDMCGICYEELKGKTALIECGECFNLLHQECADIWLRKGTIETCVYCRGPLVYAFYLQNEEQTAKKRRKEDANGYKNILK